MPLSCSRKRRFQSSSASRTRIQPRLKPGNPRRLSGNDCGHRGGRESYFSFSFGAPEEYSAAAASVLRASFAS